MPVELTHDFRLGIQLSDAHATADFGRWVFCNWLSERPRWSDWATDWNKYDPDAVRLYLERQGFARLKPADFRLAIQLADAGGMTDFGNPVLTPWVTEIGSTAAPFATDQVFTSGHWSDFAFDGNKYDPDAIRIAIIWRDWPTTVTEYRLIDMRVGIQLVDAAGMADLGDPQYTPWLGDGGGISNWAMDRNRYDFDGVRLGLEVRLENLNR